MLSLFLQNQLILRLQEENVGVKQGLFLLLKKPSFFFPQEVLCFAFTSGVFQSPELNSKSMGFGRCIHLQGRQPCCSSPRLCPQPWGGHEAALGCDTHSNSPGAALSGAVGSQLYLFWFRANFGVNF